MEDIDNNEEIYYKWKAERQQRLRLAMAIVPAIVGIVAILFVTLTADYLEMPFPISRTLITALGPVSLLFSGVAVLMIYLQTGFKSKTSSEIDYVKYESELRNLKNRIEHSTSLSTGDVDKIEEKLESLQNKIDQNSYISEAITSEHKEELVGILKADILKISSDDAFKETLEKIKKEVSKTNHLKEIESVFSRTLERLYSEISALSRRGSLNLSLGIFTTIIGLGILGYFVLEIDSIPEDKMAFIAHFIPRLSLVILIEVFAYFFLRLYKSSLSEIKYFQNEMTNAEAKLVAIKCSIMTADADSTAHVIKALSNTERNAILEKGQTTAEIEKSKIEQQNISTISDKVSNIISNKKSA
jgi:hypothetical protein